MTHAETVPVAAVSLTDEEIHYSWSVVEGSRNNLST